MFLKNVLSIYMRRTITRWMLMTVNCCDVNYKNTSIILIITLQLLYTAVTVSRLLRLFLDHSVIL